MARSVDPSPEVPGTRLPAELHRVWEVPAPRATRVPRASLSVERIAGVAVELGDAHGLAGISLSGVARRFAVATNALYRYLDSRDELRVLARDLALGPPGPEPGPGSWQEGATAWALALRARYAAHPWLADLPVRLPVTPNALAWFDALLAVLRRGPFDPRGRLRAAALLDGHVRSAAVAARDLASLGPPLAAGSPLVATLAELLAERGLTGAAAVVDAGLYREPADRRTDDEFRDGLDTILAGLAARAGEVPAAETVHGGAPHPG
ncbi:TetR/AcrR family transcriptional regulator C-terminal domain-containing protein [Pseudonocardia lacus]|uniref:TetR/AcrR family transcriptional regulator C-terminal domain-containing protein n=1 Tax=Pseudonocardia lacus TaxID=2835865 RepID=UPI001BDCEC49|nr:TetR/AcrR family transcriptional regulator C-terminal domain-containing protein [Pseudonocardia lacus]